MKKIVLISICILIPVVGLVYGERRRLPAQQQKNKPRTKKEFIQKIKKLQEEADKLKITIKTQRRKIEDLKAENEKLRSLLKNAGFDSTKIVPLGIASKFRSPLEVGQSAYLSKENVPKVEQIIDDENMLAEIRVGYSQHWQRSSVSGSSRFLTHAPGIIISSPTTKLVWIKDINTSGLVDGSKIEIEKPFKITGTKTYDTVAGGTKTVFVLEPY